MADLFGKLVVRSPRRGGAQCSGVRRARGRDRGVCDFRARPLRGGLSGDRLGARRLAASARIRALEAENARLRTEIEAADVARRVDREGYKQVERSLGDMQSQIARLNQDLSFYRGLVQPDSLVHVKVQQMQIVPRAPTGNIA